MYCIPQVSQLSGQKTLLESSLAHCQERTTELETDMADRNAMKIDLATLKTQLKASVELITGILVSVHQYLLISSVSVVHPFIFIDTATIHQQQSATSGVSVDLPRLTADLTRCQVWGSGA